MNNTNQSLSFYLGRFLIVLSIPFILYSFLFLAFLGYVPLQVEMHTLITNALILLIFISFIQHNAWYSLEKFKTTFTKKTAGIEEYIKENEIIISGKKKSLSSLEHFFDDDLREIRNDHFSSIAASIFPTLGILGTFVAIAISMPDFTSSSQEALDKEISSLLAGVGTAFYASIYGIFLSLWWTFFEKRGLSKIEAIIYNLEEKYENKVWNKEEIEILSLIQNKKNNDTLLNNIQHLISPSYVTRIEEIAKSKLEEIKNLNLEHQNVHQLLLGKYKHLEDLLAESSKTETSIQNNLNTLEKSVQSTNSSLVLSIEEQNKHSKALKAEIYSVLSSFELISGDLKNLGEQLIAKSISDEKK